jgi:hypothetical protein
MSPVYTFTPYIFKIHFNIILLLRPDLFRLGFLTDILYTFLPCLTWHKSRQSHNPRSDHFLNIWRKNTNYDATHYSTVSSHSLSQLHTLYRIKWENASRLRRMCEERSRAGIAQSENSDGLDGPSLSPGRERFSLLHSIKTDSGAQPASYRMGTGGSLPGACSWPLTSIYCRGQEFWTYTSTPPLSSWHSA